MTQPKDILENIELALRNGELTSNPHLATEYRARLSGEYSFHAGLLGEILKEKPAIWNAHRQDFKSDKACERHWESTENGINETGLELKLKRIQALISGLNSLIRLAENEAHNIN